MFLRHLLTNFLYVPKKTEETVLNNTIARKFKVG